MDLLHWRDPKKSGIALSAGLAFFFTIAILGYSSLGTVCLLAALHLIARLVYFSTIGVRSTLPDEWISEDEMLQPLVSWI